MRGPNSCDPLQGGRGWRGVAFLALLFAAGCKPGGSLGDSAADGAAEEFPSHLKLTGLVQDGSNQWALFLLAEPGEPTEYMRLMAGQRLGDLEVRAIDPAAQTVDVRVGDRDATLSLATHGLKPEDVNPSLQRLTADEHARLYNSPERQRLVEDHSRAQELRQGEELAREIEEREQNRLPPPQTPAAESD